MVSTDVYADHVNKAFISYLNHSNPEIRQIAGQMVDNAIKADYAGSAGQTRNTAFFLRMYEKGVNKLGCDPLA